MIQRYLMLGILVALCLMWYQMPKVTEKDAIAFAHATFLEYCTQSHLNLYQFHPEPKFSVEGGDKDLVFVHEFTSDNLDSVVIRIDKMGDYTVTRKPRESTKDDGGGATNGRP